MPEMLASASAPALLGGEAAAAQKDIFNLERYRCNAPPVNPYEDAAEAPELTLLAEVFDFGNWRVDSGRPRASVNEAKILASLDELGAKSPYVSCTDPESGINALHACAINGYLALFKALVEVGKMDVLSEAASLNRMLCQRLEHVPGANALWMAKRRGHKAIVSYLMSQGPVEEMLKAFGEELVVRERERLERIAERKRKLEEARLAREEAKRKEKERAQRKARDEIAGYAVGVKTYAKSFADSTFKNWDMGIDEASADMEQQLKAFGEKNKRNDNMCKIAATHEVDTEMKRSNELISTTGKMLMDFTNMWKAAKAVNSYIETAKLMKWSELVPEALAEEASKYAKSVKKLAKSVKDSTAYKGLDGLSKDFNNTCPLIQALLSPAMRERHWSELIESTGVSLTMPSKNPDLLLGDVMALNLHQGAVSNLVEEVTDKAVKEAKQEVGLGILENFWKAVDFNMAPYKESDTPMLKMGDEAFEQLDADLLIVQSMVSSRYDYWKKDSTKWQKELQTVGDVLQVLAELQRVYAYLEPLFMQSKEVKDALPTAAAKFVGVDTSVKSTLKKMWAAKNVSLACNEEGLLKVLEQLLEDHEVCKKALQEYMDGKRRLFPRFYFVSEADLLDILSNGSNPTHVMGHCDKVYLSTKAFTLKQAKGDRPTITDYIAGVGVETVMIVPPVKLAGNVESYLQAGLDAQKQMLSDRLDKSYKNYPTGTRDKWLMRRHETETKVAADPGQITLLVAAIFYANETEAAQKAIASGDNQAMVKHGKTVTDQLKELVTITCGNLDKVDRKRVMCMITMDAHSRDIIEKLNREKAYKFDDFQWQSQLKQRYVDSEQPSMKAMAQTQILNAAFMYSFEYLGNGNRLVITPLTDRIYVTATQALNLCMGCAPAGPAGTGKTESTKDLASALAVCIYVFNCSPEMDYKSLGNIFKGLAASGAWGCFDEFNRLVPAVLSVCTVQFKAVCDAVKRYVPADEETHAVVVEGDKVKLVPTCGAFITMNPGYLGRSELPQGLKALFRPMTVMVPDLTLICENFLMAEGFREAKVLASKFFGLYSLLSDLLSPQKHYDWGLRAVKSVLYVAGQLLRGSPGVPEDQVLMRALRDSNKPKIVQVDEVVFYGLLGDLFPGLDPPRAVDEELETAVAKAAPLAGYWPDERAMLKAVQLDELLAIRHCVFVMGPPGAGKSACWKLLAEAKGVKDPTQKVMITDLNPKVMPTAELYGYINMATREWKDGLLSNIMRALGQIPDDKPKWILLDGDLDANWIESMNSVMDDNKMLTLASNERIPLKAHMRMIFEIRDLNHATPATTSRAGVVYISNDEGWQWQSVIKQWIKTRDGAMYTPEVRGWLQDLFDKYCEDTLTFLKKTCTTVVPVEDTTKIDTLLRFLEGVLGEHSLVSQSRLETTFVFCAIWAFGCSLGIGDGGEVYRKIFSDYWRKSYKTVVMPPRDTVFDYYLQPESALFDPWQESPAFKEISFDSKSMSMTNVTVPTGETASASFWAVELVKKRYPVMLAGSAGSGKTSMIQGLLRDLDADTYENLVINMNFYTSGYALLDQFESMLQKQTGTTFGPSPGKSMVYFVDDLNLPELDTYNTQSAIALVRQHMDYQHWYDPLKLSLKNILGCQFLSCMNPTAGSFVINPRLQRWFTTFAVSMPNEASLTTIYETFLNGHLEVYGFNKDITSIVPNLIKATMAVHTDVCANFRKSAVNFHYEFNVRHLSNVFQGLLMSRPQKFKEAESVVRLWLHECDRIYGDRLVSYEDLAKFQDLALTQSKRAFAQYNLAKFYGDGAEPLVFNHFGDGEEPIYDQCPDMETLRGNLESALAEYNESNAVMNLVMFEDAMKHVCRITRVINNPSGHCMAVGVGGSGKKSLSRLAASICGFTTFQISISSTYGINDLKGDLQLMYNKAGVKDEGVLFLFTDNEITNERFLVYMNDLLGSAKIADLYASDEKDTVCNGVFKAAKEAGRSLEIPALYEFFIERVRKNLHVVLCFSPVGDAFRERCLKFPALANNTVIDWYQPWPEQALFSVGKRFMASLDTGGDDAKAAIEKFLPASFEAVNQAAKRYKNSDGRYVYMTPKSYLELLALYKKLLDSKRLENDTAKERLANGVKKLVDCGNQVDQIKIDLAVMLEEAATKAATADGIATTVAGEKAIVEMESDKAADEEKLVLQIGIDVTKQAQDAERDLAMAVPAVEAAMAALDTINEKDLSGCKSMTTPPPGVDDVFAAAMVLMAGTPCDTGKAIPIQKKSGKVKDSDRVWATAKKALLGNVKQCIVDLKALKTMFDDGKVPSVNWKEVRPYLKLEHFTAEVMMKKNPAAAGLCNFALNIVMYYDVVVSVEPKKKALAEANASLEAANTKLAAVKAHVKALDEKLAILVKELNAAKAEKADAEATVAKGKLKLNLAERLINALASENARWRLGIGELGVARDKLVGDTLLSAAFISYVGPFTKPYRDSLVNEHFIPMLEEVGVVPMTNPASCLATLTDDSEIAKWAGQGLPSDPVSVENGALVCRSARWPLLIDPQLQGIAWVKSMEGADDARPLQVVRLTNPKLGVVLKQSLEGGLPLLIENIGEKIDASLGPVIQRAIIARGRTQFVKLGDDEVEFHPSFQLYLQTKLSNPHYAPEIQAETTLVNFTVTPLGLEDQLLALVVRKERGDLASQKAALVTQQNVFKVKIKDLEDDILGKLAAAEGDITEDIDLIEGLEAAKKTSLEIARKLAEGKKTTEKINITAEKYRSVARRGAQLFFILSKLVFIHSYYIFSLNAFVVVFQSGIDQVQAEEKAQAKKKGGKMKFGGKNLFKMAAKKVMTSLQRFPWSTNILLSAGQASEEDMDKLQKTLLSPKKGAAGAMSAFGGAMAAKPKAEDAFAAGAVVDTDYGSGKVLGFAGGKYAVELTSWKMSGGAAPVMHLEKKAVSKHIDYGTRCTTLVEKCTSVVFNYLRRGLFTKDKLKVTALLTFSLMQDDGLLEPTFVQSWLMNRSAGDAAVPEGIGAWFPEALWPKVVAVEDDLKGCTPLIEGLCENIAAKQAAWTEWYNSSTPESDPMPGTFAGLPKPARIAVVRAMRPDRTVLAVTDFIQESMGRDYVQQPPFDMKATYLESSASTPVFFVLFPGVDPTPWVEGLGQSFGITEEKGMFINISMGQGQEEPAEAMIKTMSKKGGWIMLQNLHLMSDWVPRLERQLELCADDAHEDFRCFASAEPPPFSYQSNMPESMMQSCIKVANEAPADLQSNLRRAWANFSQDRLDACTQAVPFKACLFALCFFHASIIGRKRFGQQGWSRNYSFNTGDLTICADVLTTYLDDAKDKVPWTDLRYVWGEIMYGGHITDFWDRHTNNCYLAAIMTPGILEGGEIAADFCAPPTSLDFTGVAAYIEDKLPAEAPPIYGLHRNSEVAYLINAGEDMLSTILKLTAGGDDGGEGSGGGIGGVIVQLLADVPGKFDMFTLNENSKPKLKGEQAPFVVVALQECTRMNALLAFMAKSLEELQKGLAGQLNMTEKMEHLAEALTINQVPGRNPFHTTSWEKLAWASMKNLPNWFADMSKRVSEVGVWVETLVLPFSLWLPGLFNPTAFLTAVNQYTARRNKLALDQMAIETHITTETNPANLNAMPVDGAFVHGLMLEGARWEDPSEAAQHPGSISGYKSAVEGTMCAGQIATSRPKELLTLLPVVYCKAVTVQPAWEPTAVGYIRHESDLYNTPVFLTTFRGPTFVFTASLKTSVDPGKWTLAAVAIVMQSDAV